MNHKRILALSITSAMVLAACQQPAPAPVVAAPTINNVTATPSTVTQGSSASTVVTFSTTNGGGTISSAKATLAGSDSSCTPVSGSTTNYSCNVSVPSSLGTGSKTITVTVTNNAPTGNTVSSSTTVTVNAVPQAANPTFTATGPLGDTAAGTKATITISNLTPVSGTISSLVATLNGSSPTPCVLPSPIPATFTCDVSVLANALNGSNTIAVTAQNSAGGSTSVPVTFNVTGGVSGPILPNPVPQGGPIFTNVFVNALNLPKNSSNADVAGTATVFIDANAQDGATLNTLTISIDNVVVSTQPLPGNLTGITGNYTFPVAATVAAGSRVVTVKLTDSNNKSAQADRVLALTRPSNASSGDPVLGGTNVASDDIDPTTQFRSYRQQQVDPSNGTVFQVFYVRGRLDLQAFLPALGGDAGIEYFKSNTDTSASNKLARYISTTGLNQGEQYKVYARSAVTGLILNPDGFIFVPDNLAPQVPYIITAQQVSQLRDGLKNLLGAWVNKPFNLALDNSRTLEDQPANPGSANPGPTVRRGVGIREVRYYAFPVPNDFVADPGQVPFSPNSGIFLGSSNNNTQGGSATQANYNVNQLNPKGLSTNPNNFHAPTAAADIAALLAANPTQATPPAFLTDGRYVVVAVAYDYLGNRNSTGTLNGQNSFILNVDTVGFTGGFGVKDRGPLDVNATGVNCENRVDATTVGTQFVDMPTDVYSAENTYNPTSAAPTFVVVNGVSQLNVTFNPDDVAHNGTGNSAYVSGCAVISGALSDGGINPVGFDLNQLFPLTIGGPGFIQTPILVPSNPTTGVTFGTLTLNKTVANYNGVEGRQDIAANNFTDALGNQPETPSDRYFYVDNTAPVVQNFSVASANSTNVFLSGQQLGLQVNASDEKSRMRTNKKERFSFFYGSDYLDNAVNANFPSLVSDPLRSFDYTLVQIPRSRLTDDTNPGDPAGAIISGDSVNFNVPNPLQTPSTVPANVFVPRAGFHNDTTSTATGGQGKLGATVVAVDKAGNAKGNTTKITVSAVNLTSPVIKADYGILGGEVGQQFYRGFTTLNRLPSGVVNLTSAPDELNPGPIQLNRSRALYGALPTPGIPDTIGTPGTNAHELVIPANDVTYNGNVSFQQGAGSVNFIYRYSDPQINVGAAFARARETIASPSVLTNDLFPPALPVALGGDGIPTSRWLYNLPAFAAVLPFAPNDRKVQHIWSPIPNQSTEGADNTSINGYFKAIVGDSSTLIHNGVAALVFNNYGNAAIQTKFNPVAPLSDVALNDPLVNGASDTRRFAVDGNLTTFWDSVVAATKTFDLPLPGTFAVSQVNLVVPNTVTPDNDKTFVVVTLYNGNAFVDSAAALASGGKLVAQFTGLPDVTRMTVEYLQFASNPSTTTQLDFKIIETQVLVVK